MQDLSSTIHETRVEKYEELCERGLGAMNDDSDNMPEEQDERIMKLKGSGSKNSSKRSKAQH